MLLVNPIVLDSIIERALLEDLGESGDVTSQLIFDSDEHAQGTFLSKASGLLAGGPVLERLFTKVDPEIQITRLLPDGTPLNPGRVFCSVEGPVISLLTAERTALNILQRLSGIATMARAFREKISNFPGVMIVDTRKTTPGLRVLEKYAVRVGGGKNHRFGLFDTIMIKDNHIKAAGGIRQAVEKVRQKIGHTIKIEVEVEDMVGAVEAARAGADIVMLDNMAPDMMKRCVEKLAGNVIVEASGGINLETIGTVVKSGVDCISIGALTHSARALDLSFNIGEAEEE